MEKSKEIYDYLLENCLGYDNRIKGEALGEMFGIRGNKSLRRQIEYIRQDKQFKYLVGSEAGSNGGYWIVVNDYEKDKATSHIRLRAREQLKTCKMMERKAIYEII